MQYCCTNARGRALTLVMGTMLMKIMAVLLCLWPHYKVMGCTAVSGGCTAQYSTVLHMLGPGL